MPLYMKDLRPHLGELNAKFEPLGLIVAVIVNVPAIRGDTDNYEVVSVEVRKIDKSTHKLYTCPTCGTLNGTTICNQCKEYSMTDKEPKEKDKGGGKDTLAQKKRLSEVIEQSKHERLAEYNKPENDFPR